MLDQRKGQGANRTHESTGIPCGWKRRLSLIALSLVMIQCVVLTEMYFHPLPAMADDSISSLLSGQITAKRENELQIDQKTYPLHPNVVVQDDEGRPRELSALPVGTRISFHVKNGRIDQIVVTLAR